MSDLHQLQHRYARAVDGRDIDGIVACFTEDAHVEFNGGDVLIEGADELRLFFDRAFDNPLLGARCTSTHLLSNIVVDDGHVETQGVAYLASDDRDTIIVRGLTYSDDCVQTAAGWRIQRRLHRALWEGEMPRRPLSPPLEKQP